MRGGDGRWAHFQTEIAWMWAWDVAVSSRHDVDEYDKHWTVHQNWRINYSRRSASLLMDHPGRFTSVHYEEMNLRGSCEAFDTSEMHHLLPAYLPWISKFAVMCQAENRFCSRALNALTQSSLRRSKKQRAKSIKLNGNGKYAWKVGLDWLA